MALRRSRDAAPAGDDDPEQKVLSERVAKLIDTSPAVRDVAVEVGLVDQQWLDQPSKRRPLIAPPVEVLRRFVERTTERHPSALSSIGVNALQLLSWDLFWDRGLLRSKDSVSTATVVFIDLEGFTSYTDRFGDDAALTLLSDHQRAMGQIARRWGGRVVKRLGDGLMLVFPSASSAIYAALDMVAARVDPLRTRAGMHTGEVLVTADDLIGNVVNVAARVTADARGGQVLATAETLGVAGELDGVRALRARRRSYKGVGQKVSVCRLERVADEDG